MGDAPFLVLGESLVDLIGRPGSWRFEAAPGGSPLNVAVALAAAGQRVRLASQVGDDFFGAMLREHLERYRVETADLAVTGEPTSLAFARIDADGAAGYDFRFAWTWRAAPLPLEGVACLHVGSLAAVVTPGADAVAAAVAEARQHGVTVSFDPNVRPTFIADRGAATARIEQLVAAAHIVKVSSEDLAWLYPGVADLEAAAGWAARGPGLVVLTRGAGGAVALHEGRTLACAAPPAPVVDTVGAGDVFTAGLLAHLSRAGVLAAPTGAEVGTALRCATAAATAACTRRGAAPPPPDQVAALLDQIEVTT